MLIVKNGSNTFFKRKKPVVILTTTGYECFK